jgi:hypothetical protein
MALTNEFVVLEADPISGVQPARTYFATKSEAVNYATGRLALFGTVEIAKVVRRWHTVVTPVTTEEDAAPDPMQAPAPAPAPMALEAPAAEAPVEIPPPAPRRRRRT